MTERAVPRPPADLSPASVRDWPELVSDLRATTGAAEVDLRLLADALRITDRLTEIGATLARDGLTVTGSKGQTRPHPLILIESTLRKELAAAYERLNLAPRTRSGDVEVARNGRLRPYQ